MDFIYRPKKHLKLLFLRTFFRVKKIFSSVVFTRERILPCRYDIFLEGKMENGKQSEWKVGQNAKDGEKNYFALETVFVRIYNVLVTARPSRRAMAELMKDRCPSEGD